jgi:hypothetical protein
VRAVHILPAVPSASQNMKPAPQHDSGSTAHSVHMNTASASAFRNNRRCLARTAQKLPAGLHAFSLQHYQQPDAMQNMHRAPILCGGDSFYQRHVLRLRTIQKFKCDPALNLTACSPTQLLQPARHKQVSSETAWRQKSAHTSISILHAFNGCTC